MTVFAEIGAALWEKYGTWEPWDWWANAHWNCGIATVEEAVSRYLAKKGVTLSDLEVNALVDHIKKNSTEPHKGASR